MLKDYPIYFDDVKLFTPESWDESYEVIETTNQTEAGTDQTIVVRTDKLSVSASFNCSSRTLATFAAYRDKDSFVLKLYDLKTQAYKERTIRLRNFKSSPVTGSEKTVNTNGLYTVSFDLEEF